jgi:hypothetical protein
VPTPAMPQQYTGYTARRLVQLYHAISETDERQLIGDAIRALHLVCGDRLLGWLVEEQEYQDLVTRNVPYLGHDHRVWLGRVRAQIDAEIAAVDDFNGGGVRA